jgi:hypothetical protein
MRKIWIGINSSVKNKFTLQNVSSLPVGSLWTGQRKQNMGLRTLIYRILSLSLSLSLSRSLCKASLASKTFSPCSWVHY